MICIVNPSTDSLSRNYKKDRSEQSCPEVAHSSHRLESLLNRKVAFEESPSILNRKKAQPGKPTIIKYDNLMGRQGNSKN